MDTRTLLVPLVALSLLSIGVAGCLDQGPESGGVVATTYVVGYLAAAIAGEDVPVTILGNGAVEVHDYEPTLSDLTTMREAGVILYHGLGLEPWLASALRSLGSSGPDALETVAFANGGTGLPGTSGGGTIDPHTWLDPLNLIEQSRQVEAAMTAIWPEHATAFASRGEVFRGQVMDLHTTMATGLTDCAGIEIVVDHNAYAYLADRYWFQVLPLRGNDPEAEPTPNQVADLIEGIETGDHHIMFLEETADPSRLDAIVDATGVDLRVLNTLEVAPASGDYLSAMQENLVGLQAALGCPT